MTAPTTDTTATAQLWNIEIDKDYPKKHLPLMVKVATGTNMDDYGKVISMNKNEWEKYREEYSTIAENHVKKCKNRGVNLYLNYQKPIWDKE